MAGNKTLPKEVSNWLLSLELDRRKNVLFCMTTWQISSKKVDWYIWGESLKQNLPTHNQDTLPVLHCVKVRLCNSVYQGNTSLFLQLALWDAMTFALRASQEQWYFWLNKADLWKKVSCCVFPPLLRHEYCLGWATEFLGAETAFFSSILQLAIIFHM